jgi:hypothetical protein
MRVRYQIIVEVDADGMMGPLKIIERISHRIDRIGDNENPQAITIGQIRLAAIYPLASPEQKPVVERVPGSDQSREVEEVRDPRIT